VTVGPTLPVTARTTPAVMAQAVTSSPDRRKQRRRTQRSPQRPEQRRRIVPQQMLSL
jgi:hypothetical protein